MLTANICRNAAAIAFRLGGRITIGTPYRPQNVYRNGVPVRSGTATPLVALGQNQIGQYCIGPSLARWGPRKLQGQDQCPVHCVSADNFFCRPLQNVKLGGGRGNHCIREFQYLTHGFCVYIVDFVDWPNTRSTGAEVAGMQKIFCISGHSFLKRLWCRNAAQKVHGLSTVRACEVSTGSSSM